MPIMRKEVNEEVKNEGVMTEYGREYVNARMPDDRCVWFVDFLVELSGRGTAYRQVRVTRQGRIIWRSG